MIEIDDLRGLGEMQIGLIPYPCLGVCQNDLFLRTAPTPPPSFRIKATPEFLRSLNGAHVGGRIFVPDGIPFLVHRGLREHAAQFHFPGVSGLAVLFPRTSFGFFAYDRNTCAIHLHVEDWNPWSQRNR